jgi:hypothetical protein
MATTPSMAANEFFKIILIILKILFFYENICETFTPAGLQVGFNHELKIID